MMDMHSVMSVVSWCAMAKQKVDKAGALEVLPPALSASAAAELATPGDVERFNRVLAAVSEGASLTSALAREGVTGGAAQFGALAARYPQLMVELDAMREWFRSMLLFRSYAEMNRRLDRAEEISTRDLTDFARAAKPFDKAGAQRIEIVVE